MSKEQTPINIQSELTSLYGKYGWSEMFLYKAQLLFDSESEKNANAKVLEALEREVIKIAADLQYQMFIITSNPTTVGDLEYLKIEAFNRSKDYYETEVKPKYEKERKQRSN